MSDKMSEEKVSLLRAYGAEVVVCPTAVPPEHPDSYYSVADRLTRETPGAFRPDQYSNPANPAEHERSTGPEIWRQTDGPGHALRRRRRHRRHHHRRRPVPQGAEPRRADRRRRSRGLGVLGRHRPSVPRRGRRRGLLAHHLRPVARRPHVMVSDAESFAAARRVTARGGPAHRRVVRHRGARRARRRRASSGPTRWSSCCCPTPGATTCRRSSTTTG